MSPIQEAIEYLELHEAEDDFSYREVVDMFGVDRTTLSRRHQGSQCLNEAMAAAQQLLNSRARACQVHKKMHKARLATDKRHGIKFC
jgi:hypothetical protein